MGGNDIPPYYMDISGMFNIQRNMVQSFPTDGNPTTTDAMKKVSSSLDNLYNSFIGTGVTTLGTLDHQQQMMNIVNTENDRLNKKMGDINTAMVGKQRALELNESYRLRYQQYMKMITVVVIALLLVILFSYLNGRFPVIPSWVWEVLSIITVSSGIVIIFYMFRDLVSRSNVNYNELAIPAPGSGINGNNISGKDVNSQNLLSGINLNMCIGSSCCNDGTHWDDGNAVCIGNTITVSGFTTISQSKTGGNISNQGLVKANYPTELDDYSYV